MKTIIYSQDDRVVPWVAERIGETDFGGCTSIGQEENGELICGVVYNWFMGPSCAMHVAAVPGKRWLTYEFLNRVFTYPFIQLGCNRVTGMVRADNYKAQKLDEHLGFKREGLIRQATWDKQDMIVYGMLKDECRWIKARE